MTLHDETPSDFTAPELYAGQPG
ncbi:hypothetical protein U2A4042630032 [Corynebacterium striatum]|nr:hypothetical protein U2A4042630032 [Corynebacterium striatum]